MKDKAGTRSDLKAAKRSQVFFLNLEKKGAEMSGEQYVWAINQRLSTCCVVSDVNPVQKDVSASKMIQEDVMDLSLHLLNRFPASGDDYMVPSSAEKANIQQCIWKGGKSQNFASQRLKLIHPLRLPTVKIVMPGLAGCDHFTTSLSTTSSLFLQNISNPSKLFWILCLCFT